MKYNIIRLLMLGLSTVCAGALSEAELNTLFPGPSVTTSTQATTGVDNWYGLLRRNVDHMLEKRAEGITKESDIKNLDMEGWSRDTVKLCVEKFESATLESNPAGVAGCWNVPVLVASSGVFAADLRLFRVSEPTGDWEDVPVSAYNISLEYDGGAAIQSRNLTEKERRASEEGMPEGTNLVRLIDSQFIGNLDQTALASNPSDTELKALVTPKLSIKASTPTGKEVSTTVSIEQAQFLNGVFADTPNLSQEQTEDIKAAPFELPGTRIEIVPAGLYFFSAYLVVACSIFGWGTFERAKFRDQYRKRIATHRRR